LLSVISFGASAQKKSVKMEQFFLAWCDSQFDSAVVSIGIFHCIVIIVVVVVITKKHLQSICYYKNINARLKM